MKILNYGSLNIDHVYRVAHIARPGETIASRDLGLFAGGKGANQSVALGRAGAAVYHAGRIGPDGAWLLDGLRASGVDVRDVVTGAERTGHAVIQVDDGGENSIVLYGGANLAQNRPEIDRVLARFDAGDMLLLQNEINEVPYLLEQARSLGLRTCFNPAPYAEEVQQYPLDCVDIFVVNETEGKGLTRGCEAPEDIVTELQRRFGAVEIVLTLGAQGVLYAGRGQHLVIAAARVEAVDTTAAGDTFIGYLLADYAAGVSMEEVLKTACRAAALCVTRPGATESIPFRREL